MTGVCEREASIEGKRCGYMGMISSEMVWDVRLQSNGFLWGEEGHSMRRSIGPAQLSAERFRGEAVRAGGLVVTPIGQRLSVHWAGSGLVWLFPVAVEVSGREARMRLPLWNVTRLIVSALAMTGALFGVIAARRLVFVRREGGRS